MKTILKLFLSGIILFGAVPTVNAMDMKMDNMEEVKKKKKKKKKLGGAKGKKIGAKKGKKSKKGFFSKIFGSK